MVEVPKFVAAYLRDAMKVWLFPVTTISDAADRELTVGQIAGVFVSLVLLTSVLSGLSGLLLNPSAVAATLSFGALVGELSWIVVFAIGGAVLLLAIRIVGGRATPRRLFSALLVFPGIHALVAFLALLVAVVGVVSMWAGTADLLTSLGFVGSVALTLILLSYTVLVARYGGRLGFAAALGATLLYLFMMLGLDFLFQLYVLGEPFVPLGRGGIADLIRAS